MRRFEISSWGFLLVIIVVTTTITSIHTAAATTTTAADTNAAADVATTNTEQESPTCSWLDEECHFKTMTVDLDSDTSPDTFRAYITPDVATFYNKTPGALKPKHLTFQGLFGKFINMSPQVVRVMWDPMIPGQPHSYISDMDAFESSGTATFPGHVFHVTPRHNPNQMLTTFHVVANQSLYVYDPYERNLTKARASLSKSHYALYRLQYDNLQFNDQYRQVTGREWLALYSRKHPPRHPMWPAQYIGQRHVVPTTEWPFVQVPPEHLQGLERNGILAWAHEPDPEETERNRKLLQPYRAIPGRTAPIVDNSTTTTVDPTEPWNMTLKVVSCSPRVFEISNFLSPAEVDHILQLATGMTLAQSTTQGGRSGEQRTDSSTRTSQNSWLARETSLVLDALYRRAADAMQMDESLFRYRNTPHPSVPESQMSIAERLQLVHYDVGQQYVRTMTMNAGHTRQLAYPNMFLPWLGRRLIMYVVLDLTEQIANFNKCRFAPGDMWSLPIPIIVALFVLLSSLSLLRISQIQDFAMPGLSDGQPSRFATMLFYLNDGMTGGETSFPRFLNAKTKKPLKVKPKAGKAILFYNVLPDGNYDERSQHAAEPVLKGEKWLTNLWVWVS